MAARAKMVELALLPLRPFYLPLFTQVPRRVFSEVARRTSGSAIMLVVESDYPL